MHRKNMIWITETQANKLQALGIPVDVGYVIDAALITSFTDIMESGKPTSTHKRKTRTGHAPRFTHLQAVHNPQGKWPKSLREAVLKNSEGNFTGSVVGRVKHCLYSHMRDRGVRSLSRAECYEVLKTEMPNVFVLPSKPYSLAGALFSVAQSAVFMTLTSPAGVK